MKVTKTEVANSQQWSYTRLLLWVICLFNLFGCATSPLKPQQPGYLINGVRYFQLESLYRSSDISFTYDTFSRVVTLNKGVHTASFMVGQDMAVVDNRSLRLQHPVELYQGMLVVPADFEEKIIRELAKEPAAVEKIPPLQLIVKKIVIDPGHGGDQPGAVSRSHLREKDLNLDIAKRLASLLRAAGFEVVLTRSTDKSLSLSERVQIANNSGAEIFLSIHGNANRVRRLSGFEVYYLCSKASDASRATKAANSYALNQEGSCFASDSLALKATLWDMLYTYNRAESVRLAQAVCRAAGDSLDTRIIGAKGANFYVLNGLTIPGVLVEVGFLTNQNEECMLRNNFYRQQIAGAIEAGIKNYAQALLLAQSRNE